MAKLSTKKEVVVKALTEFTEQTLKSAGTGYCPFLQRWMGETFQAILDSTPGKDLLMQRKKLIYALYLVINPKFSKKRFGEVFEIAYGTARNWINDSKINEVAATYADDFVNKYISEIKKIVTKPIGRTRLADYIENRGSALNNLFREAAFYTNGYLVRVLLLNIPKLPDFGDEKANVSGENNTLFFAGCRFMQLVGSLHGVENPQFKKEYCELIKKQHEAEFAMLKVQIKFGNPQDAIEFVEVLEKRNLQQLDDISYLETELLKVKRTNEKKSDQKFGKSI
jgi:hypothetical protein